jgi:hypothetical protein
LLENGLLAHGLDDFLDHGVIPQVGRGVVGVSQVGDGRTVFGNGLKHGRLIQLEVRSQGHAMKSQALQLGAHGIHHKARHRRQHTSGPDLPIR